MIKSLARPFITSFIILTLLSAFTSFTFSQPPQSIKLDLTLARDGATWSGEVKINAGGHESSQSAQKLSVSGDELSFSANLEGAEVRFSGKRAGDQLGGTLEAFEKGKRVGTGAWSLARIEGDAGALTGRWSGTFNAQSVPQQQVDPSFDTKVAHPAYAKTHPRVLFDEAHNNIHTTTGLYKPFVDLIQSDGYTVVPNKETFRQETLAPYDVLVIVNAAGARGHRADPAFTNAECDAVREWVRGGGSLLFIADHAPMGAAAEILARRFNVEMSKAYTDDPSSTDKVLGDILFSRENHLLADHAITRGRNRSERVSRVVTFTGQSLKGSADSVALLQLSATAVDTNPATKQSVPAAGRSQGLALQSGKGRAVILGEAAMLSAQIDSDGRAFGMNYPRTDNRQLALNIMHWLTRLLN